MASLEASPGKENQAIFSLSKVKTEPEAVPVPIIKQPANHLNIKQEPVDSKFIKEPNTGDDLTINSRWILEQADTFKGDEPAAMFDALGSAGLLVRALKTNLTLAYDLGKKNDEKLAAGAVNPLEGLERASSITSSADHLIKASSIVLQKIVAACTVTAYFEELAAPLADFIEYMPKRKPYKFSANELVELTCKLLKKMQDSSSGPHDSSLLKATEKLFMVCFSSSNSKLRSGAVSMWNKTFGNSKDLQYSDKLRQVLIAISKKASIFLPGLSVELITEESKASTPHKIRTTTKRLVAALVDEDSVDYVLIPQTDSAKKKMKLTDHQKELFSTTREKIPYMDEDSTQFKTNVLSRIGSQYDVDTTSQIASTSAAQTIVPPVFKNPAEAKSSEQMEVEPKDSDKKNEKKPKGKRGRPPKSAEKGEKKIVEKSPETSNSGDGSRRRSVRRNLALSAPEEKETKKVEEKRTEQVEEKKTEEKPDEIALTDSPAELSESSQDAVSNSSGRSRRSKNKGTPSKFVPEKRRRSAAIRSSSAKKVKTVTPAKNNNKNDSDEEDSETLSQIIAKEKKNNPNVHAKKVSKTPVTSDDDVSPTPSAENSQVTPTKAAEEKNTAPEPATVTTPGILKKAGTPSTHDRRRMRVHFTQEMITLDEKERNKVVATPRRVPSRAASVHRCSPLSVRIPAPSQAPVYPILADEMVPINKIIDQLTPVKTSSASAILLKQLSKKNIVTIGALAAAPESIVTTLPVKLNTVKCVLQKYARIIGKETAPEEQTEEAPAAAITVPVVPQILSSPSAVSRAVHADDAMETEELKTIEFSPVKVVEEEPVEKILEQSKEVAEPETVVIEAPEKEESSQMTEFREQLLSLIRLANQMELSTPQVKELLSEVMSLHACLLQKL